LPTIPGLSEEQVRLQIRSIVIELAPNPDGQTFETGRLAEDFGYHSLALLELAFTLEDEFNLPPLDEKTARSILTLKDVQDHVVKELRSTGELV
jgi:acyl carrier protein